MAVISTAEIPCLCKILEDFAPFSYRMYYTAQNILAGKLDAVIVADQWPDPGVLMMRHKQSADISKRWNVSTMVDLFCLGATSSTAFSFLQQHLDWTEEMIFCGIADDVTQQLHQLVNEKSLTGKLEILDDNFLMFVGSGEMFTSPSLPHGYELGALTLSDVEQIDREWTYGGSEDSKAFITFGIKTFPGKGIRNVKTGQLASYCQTLRDGSIGLWYTDAQERGKHFGRIVLSSLTCHLQTVCNHKPYLLTRVQNTRAIAIVKQVGYVCADTSRLSNWTLFTPENE